MDRVVVTSKVGEDGVLHLSVPLDRTDAGREVRVTVEAVRPLPTPEEWQRFIRETAGSIPDPTFYRHDQGEYEERDPL